MSSRSVSAQAATAAWIGPLFAVLGVLGFSFKAILVKLAYVAHPVDPVTLLALRMLYSAPLFAVLAFRAERAPGAKPMTRRDAAALVALGFLGYYLSSYVDFVGLQYITASLERLILFTYPTIVVLLSALLHGRGVTRRTAGALVLCYAGVVLVFASDLRTAGESADLFLGVALVFASAMLYAVYLVFAAPLTQRLGSQRFVAWAMLASTVFVLAQFFATHPVAKLDVPARVHALAAAMAVLSTVLPTWLMAEALKRIGANRAALVGSLGPVFTIALGAWLLGESLHALQFAGVALVLAGVWQVTGARATGPARGT